MTADLDPVTEALDSLAVWIDDLNHRLPGLLAHAGLLEAGDAERVVPVLARMDALRKRLHALQADVERHVTRALGTGEHTVAGIALKVHGGWQRTEWQHAEVGRLLVERSLLDEDTGEVPDPDDPVVKAALAGAAVVLAAGRMDWRVTDLRAAGIDPGGLCKEELKRKTVQLLTPAEAT